jgi:hypothetical protein
MCSPNAAPYSNSNSGESLDDDCVFFGSQSAELSTTCSATSTDTGSRPLGGLGIKVIVATSGAMAMLTPPSN